MSQTVYQDGVLREKWDDVTRTYTAYNSSGVQISSRAYTGDEIAFATSYAASLTQDTNKSTIQTNLASDLAAMQAIIDQTNADLRTDPSQEIKDIARGMRRLIRMTLQNFDGSS
jgi:hypothetical protein